MQTATIAPRSVLKDETQLVTFLLKDEEFAFDIMSVQEIIRVPKIAKVPHTPPCVEGIANLRGVILPIIDVCTRFGMERTEETDGTRVLIVDVGGVKTGLRVDCVKRVTRVLRSQMELRPAAIRGAAADYLEGLVKLQDGQRIIMALNASLVCQLDAVRGKGESLPLPDNRPNVSGTVSGKDGRVQDSVQMVTFRIGNDEFAIRMEHVREILRVRTPVRVPDAPDYMPGVLTVRGPVLPIMDLRRLLQRTSLAEELASECREIRKCYEIWLEQADSQRGSRADHALANRLRAWSSGANGSSQILADILSRARGLNETLIEQLDSQATKGEIDSTWAQASAALRQFEREVGAEIQEDQRIIVVDVNGFVFGLVVDRVNEVTNVAGDLLDPPPIGNSRNGLELEAVAKLNGGDRLIMLLDAGRLIKDHQTNRGRSECVSVAAAETMANADEDIDTQSLSNEVHLITFKLGNEEYGVPISKIKEIERLAKITKIPNAAWFVEGVTNLRGEVVPVLDTRKRLGLDVREYDDRTRVIILELNGVKTGLIVDSVREVLRLPEKDIAPPPEAIQSTIDHRFVAGIGKVESGNRMVVLLDVEKVLAMREQTDPGEIKGL